VGSPAGDLQALLPPANNNTFEYRMDPIPALGEHTIAILSGLGRSDADIAQLSAGGIV
jgi:formyl-CoA transferase